MDEMEKLKDRGEQLQAELDVLIAQRFNVGFRDMIRNEIEKWWSEKFYESDPPPITISGFDDSNL